VGILLGVLVMVVFSAGRAVSAVLGHRGQPGAAAAVLENMRGSWTVTPAIAANRNMDVVHRAVGKPGVILVGEGSPTRLASLLAAEKKRVARVAYEVPIVEFQVGSGEGQVPISKLQRKIMRLPRQLKPEAISDLNHRLKALQPSLQAPKGPLPKNARQPRCPGRRPARPAHREDRRASAVPAVATCGRRWCPRRGHAGTQVAVGPAAAGSRSA